MASLTYFQAIILGLVQGLGEFLPISSSGHLSLLQYFFGIEGESVLFFAVMLHVGTLISVFVVYWKDIARLIYELCCCIRDICKGRGPRINANQDRRLGFMIIVATIPTAIMGILFNDIFESFYGSIVAIAIGLIITGIILMVAEKMGKSEKTVTTMKFRHAVIIGIMQGIAITPGISRSGSTLFGGLMTGLKREFAVKFAFLISIPSILGSVVVELPPALKAGMDGSMVGPMLVGILVSAVTGFAAIKAMIKLVSNKKTAVFSYYVWALGLAVIIYSIVS